MGTAWSLSRERERALDLISGGALMPSPVGHSRPPLKPPTAAPPLRGAALLVGLSLRHSVCAPVRVSVAVAVPRLHLRARSRPFGDPFPSPCPSPSVWPHRRYDPSTQ